LNFRNRGSFKITGNIELNGKRVYDLQKISLVSGYVQQEDLFIGSLKVKEHLLFQVKPVRLNAELNEKKSKSVYLRLC